MKIIPIIQGLSGGRDLNIEGIGCDATASVAGSDAHVIVLVACAGRLTGDATVVLVMERGVRSALEMVTELQVAASKCSCFIQADTFIGMEAHIQDTATSMLS